MSAMCAPLIASKYLAGVSLGCAVRAVRVSAYFLDSSCSFFVSFSSSVKRRSASM